jgi:hypothetical protein
MPLYCPEEGDELVCQTVRDVLEEEDNLLLYDAALADLRLERPIHPCDDDEFRYRICLPSCTLAKVVALRL